MSEPFERGRWRNYSEPVWYEGRLSVAAHLHPSTEPQAIAAAQRAAVRRALRRFPAATAAEISELVLLPVSIVERRLGEIRAESR